jgi:hypothetical protein
MNPNSVNEYFLAYPNLEECFETFEGVLHPSKVEADNWVNRHSNKKVVIYKNPSFVKIEEPAKVEELIEKVGGKK